MLSEKYLAGFLDADGCIYIQWLKEGWKPQLRINFSQKTEQDKVIGMIHEEYKGGYLKTTMINGVNYTGLDYCGKTADMLLNRIKKHLVIKRRYADICISLSREKAYNIPELKKQIKTERQIKSMPLPNFPSRKWLAGYIDGDGCISTQGLHRLGAANIVLHIACSNYDTEGIELIQKAYGGNINDMSEGRCKQLKITLHPTKADEIFKPIVKYMVTKQSQAKLLLGCAEMKHYRDGKGIQAALKQLKASPHRLNEPEVEVRPLLETVLNLEKPWSKDGKYYACVECGSKGRYCGDGLCSACYQRRRKARIASTYAIVGQPIG